MHTPQLKPLKWYRALAEAKYRSRRGMFVVEGPRAVAQVIRAAPERITEILVAEDVDFAPPAGMGCRHIPSRQFGSIATSRTPQGVLAVVSLPEDITEPTPPSGTGDVLLCEHVQDPGNIGNLIRCAAAFGFAGVVLSEKCADPFSPKAVQASAGSIVGPWVRRGATYLQIARTLKENQFTLAATDTSGESRWTPAPDRPLLLAVGSEGQGLSSELLAMADTIVQIPFDTLRAESLNVASAGAVCMHTAFIRHQRSSASHDHTE